MVTSSPSSATGLRHSDRTAQHRTNTRTLPRRRLSERYPWSQLGAGGTVSGSDHAPRWSCPRAQHAVLGTCIYGTVGSPPRHGQVL